MAHAGGCMAFAGEPFTFGVNVIHRPCHDIDSALTTTSPCFSGRGRVNFNRGAEQVQSGTQPPHNGQVPATDQPRGKV